MVEIISERGFNYLLQDNGQKRLIRDEAFFRMVNPSVAEAHRRMLAKEAASGRYTSLDTTIDPETGEIIEKLEIRLDKLPHGGGFMANGSSVEQKLEISYSDPRSLSGDAPSFDSCGKYNPPRKTAVAVVGYRRPLEYSSNYGSCILEEIESARWIYPEEVELRSQNVSLADRVQETVPVHVLDLGISNWFNKLEID